MQVIPSIEPGDDHFRLTWADLLPHDHVIAKSGQMAACWNFPETQVCQLLEASWPSAHKNPTKTASCLTTGEAFHN